MKAPEIICLVGGALLALVAGTATARFGLDPMDAAFAQNAPPPAVVANDPAAAAAATPGVLTAAAPMPASKPIDAAPARPEHATVLDRIADDASPPSEVASSADTTGAPVTLDDQAAAESPAPDADAAPASIATLMSERSTMAEPPAPPTS